MMEEQPDLTDLSITCQEVAMGAPETFSASLFNSNWASTTGNKALAPYSTRSLGTPSQPSFMYLSFWAFTTTPGNKGRSSLNFNLCAPWTSR